MKGTIGVTTENIFPVIKKFLYSDHEIFLRELVSNAVDATQKLRTLSSFGEYNGELSDMNVTVSIDSDEGTLTVSDHGIGMTADDIEKYINQIAFSGAEEFLEKYKDSANAIIGHFGLDTFYLLPTLRCLLGRWHRHSCRSSHYKGCRQAVYETSGFDSHSVAVNSVFGIRSVRWSSRPPAVFRVSLSPPSATACGRRGASSL